MNVEEWVRVRIGFRVTVRAATALVSMIERERIVHSRPSRTAKHFENDRLRVMAGGTGRTAASAVGLADTWDILATAASHSADGLPDSTESSAAPPTIVMINSTGFVPGLRCLLLR